MTVAPRQLFLRTFLAFLVLTALVAIAAVLQAEWDETQARLLGNSAAIALAAVCGLVGAAALERGCAPAFARLTIALAVAAGIVVSAAIWMDPHELWAFRAVLTLGVAAVAAAHGLLLWLPRLPAQYRPVQKSSSAAILALMLMIDAMVWLDFDGEEAIRVLTVLAIIVALLTLSIPILAKVNAAPVASASVREAAPGEERVLLLRPLGGDVYADERGKRYRVEALQESSR